MASSFVVGAPWYAVLPPLRGVEASVEASVPPLQVWRKRRRIEREKREGEALLLRADART
ncbi:MAG: hypothetical protein EOO08_09770 [Chitinophagaceae bacterium]|nr:MAG: hypothetical protein EOO08_09770 [Chitinophagaceae bacterium]